jgi:hypothetical protein
MGGSSVENPKLGMRPAARSFRATIEASNGEFPVAIEGSPKLHTPEKSGAAFAAPGSGGAWASKLEESAAAATITTIARAK